MLSIYSPTFSPSRRTAKSKNKQTVNLIGFPEQAESLKLLQPIVYKFPAWNSLGLLNLLQFVEIHTSPCNILSKNEQKN